MNISEDQAAVYQIIADIIMKCLWSIVLMGCYITLLITFIVTKNIIFGGVETIFTIAIIIAVKHYFPASKKTVEIWRKRIQSKCSGECIYFLTKS